MIPRGKLEWSVHPNHKKHVFPLIPSGVWQSLELSSTGTSAASPIMELNGISFAFGSFHSELFSAEDINSGRN